MLTQNNCKCLEYVLQHMISYRKIESIKLHDKINLSHHKKGI